MILQHQTNDMNGMVMHRNSMSMCIVTQHQPNAWHHVSTNMLSCGWYHWRPPNSNRVCIINITSWLRFLGIFICTLSVAFVKMCIFLIKYLFLCPWPRSGASICPSWSVLGLGLQSCSHYADPCAFTCLPCATGKQKTISVWRFYGPGCFASRSVAEHLHSGTRATRYTRYQ